MSIATRTSEIIAPAATPASAYSDEPTEQPRGSGSDGSSKIVPHILSTSALDSSCPQCHEPSHCIPVSVVNAARSDHERPCLLIAAMRIAYVPPGVRSVSVSNSSPTPSHSGYQLGSVASFACHLAA
eukprot:6388702-Prymnesium_polylepis.1